MKRENIKRASELSSEITGLEQLLEDIKLQEKTKIVSGFSIMIPANRNSSGVSITRYISKEMRDILVILAKNEVERIIAEKEKEIETL
jgi:hypothetical protein